MLGSDTPERLVQRAWLLPSLRKYAGLDSGATGRRKWYLLHVVPGVGQGKSPRGGRGSREKQLTGASLVKKDREEFQTLQREFKDLRGVWAFVCSGQPALGSSVYCPKQTLALPAHHHLGITFFVL